MSAKREGERNPRKTGDRQPSFIFIMKLSAILKPATGGIPPS